MTELFFTVNKEMVDIRGGAFLAFEYIMLFFTLYFISTRYPWAIVFVLGVIAYIHITYFTKDVTLALLPNYLLVGVIIFTAILSGKRSWDVFNVYVLGKSKKGVRDEMYKNILSMFGLAASAYLLI